MAEPGTNQAAASEPWIDPTLTVTYLCCLSIACTSSAASGIAVEQPQPGPDHVDLTVLEQNTPQPHQPTMQLPGDHSTHGMSLGQMISPESGVWAWAEVLEGSFGRF